MSENPSGGAAAGPSELKQRVVSALVLAAAVVVATLVGGWPFRLVWAAAAGLVAYEWLAIVSRRNAVPAGLGVAAAGVLLGFVPVSPAALAGVSAFAAFFGAVLTPVLERRRWLEICGIAYALAFAVITPALRSLPEIGLGLILWTFAVCWLTDIGAYFTGRALGGPKLMPAISPKKTWSGALGGAAAGTLAGYLVWAALPSAATAVSPLFVILASLLGSIVSQAGDLFESAVKRRFGTKDSSQLIPGHGGFFDRLDGYWAVLVLAGAALFLARLEF